MCLSVSSGWFDIHRYPISFDVIKHIFIGVYGFFVFYGMELHFCNYHSYDNFYPYFLHFILFRYWCVYGFRWAVIVYISIDLCSVVFCFYCWSHWFVLCVFFDLCIFFILFIAFGIIILEFIYACCIFGCVVSVYSFDIHEVIYENIMMSDLECCVVSFI